MLWDRRTGRLTVVIRVSPVGLDLADRDQADAWVAGFGGFLADLGYQPMVRHVAITVDTAPSGGTTLRDYVAGRLDPAAPAAGPGGACSELVDATPATSADVDTRVAITFDPARANPRPADLVSAVAEVTRWLPGLEAEPGRVPGSRCSAGPRVEWLIGRLRVAYDPASRGDVARVLDQHAATRRRHAVPGTPARVAAADELLAWRDAGPLRASESLGPVVARLGGVGVLGAGRGPPPGGAVPGARSRCSRRARSRAGSPCSTSPTRPRRRPPRWSARSPTTRCARAFARRTRRDETQRERDDQARALQAAREEAEGAGVGRFTFYITTTIAADTADRRAARRRGRRRRAARRAVQAAAAPAARRPGRRVRRRPRVRDRPGRARPPGAPMTRARYPHPRQSPSPVSASRPRLRQARPRRACRPAPPGPPHRPPGRAEPPGP